MNPPARESEESGQEHKSRKANFVYTPSKFSFKSTQIPEIEGFLMLGKIVTMAGQSTNVHM